MDIKKLRAQTPGTSTITHFNNSASGLMSQATLDAISAQLSHEALKGQIEAMSEFNSTDLYTDAGRLLNASPDEIAIVESHSRGFGSALGRLTLHPGDRVLVTRAEWGGNVVALTDMVQRFGAKLEVMPVDEDGVTDVIAVKQMIDERVKLICITWCPANGGLINPAEELVAVGCSVNALTVVDAAQVVGQLPVDVRALNCDVLTVPGRKYLRAPRGTGLLYVAKRALHELAPAVLDNRFAYLSNEGINLRPDARRFENPDMPPSLKAGLAVAINDALELGVVAINKRITLLAERVRSGLALISGVKCQDLGRMKSGIVSLTISGIPATDVRTRLAQRHMTVGMIGRNFAPFDMEERNINEIIRVSPHVYTTEEEVDQLLNAIEDIAVLGRRG